MALSLAFSFLFSNLAIRDPNWMARLGSDAVFSKPMVWAIALKIILSPVPLSSDKFIFNSNGRFDKKLTTRSSRKGNLPATPWSDTTRLSLPRFRSEMASICRCNSWHRLSRPSLLALLCLEYPPSYEN